MVGPKLAGDDRRGKVCSVKHFNETHGHAKARKPSRTYYAWTSMIQRCENPAKKSYPRYGGRGIRVCERWRVFENFLADMGEAPEGFSLDRIDNDGNYEPQNCRWASTAEQNRNRSITRRITAFGKTQCLAEWAREVGINEDALRFRLKRGLPPEVAFTMPITPPGERRWKRLAA